MYINQNEKSLEAKARRVAKQAGLLAVKSRKGAGSYSNQGGFMLVNPASNLLLHGALFDLTPAEVIEYCSSWVETKKWVNLER